MTRGVRGLVLSVVTLTAAIVLRALLWGASGPFGHQACAELFAETGDERFNTRDEKALFGCFFDRREYTANKRQHFAEVEARARQAAERPTPPGPTTFETAPNHAELVRLLGGPVCTVLARGSNDARQLDVELVTFSDHEPVYSISAVEAPGAADMTHDWSDVSGHHFCTDGGLSGGDCVKRFPPLTQTATFSLRGTLPTLLARLECAHP